MLKLYRVTLTAEMFVLDTSQNRGGKRCDRCD